VLEVSCDFTCVTFHSRTDYTFDLVQFHHYENNLVLPVGPSFPFIFSMFRLIPWRISLLCRSVFPLCQKRYRDRFHVSVEDINLKSVAETTAARRERVAQFTFTEFIDAVTDDTNPVGNIHWKPQSDFCNIGVLHPWFDFIGNYEAAAEHLQAWSQCGGTWEKYGSSGWGPEGAHPFFGANSNIASHRTSHLYQNTTLALNITSKMRAKVKHFFKADYEMSERIQSPLFNASFWE
jgi:hypothetical protein